MYRRAGLDECGESGPNRDSIPEPPSPDQNPNHTLSNNTDCLHEREVHTSKQPCYNFNISFRLNTSQTAVIVTEFQVLEVHSHSTPCQCGLRSAFHTLMRTRWLASSLDWTNIYRENVQRDPLPLVSNMSVTNSDTLDNMHPRHDTAKTHNSCYQEPWKLCQTASPSIKITGYMWKDVWWIWNPKRQKLSIPSLFRHETLTNTSLPQHPNISEQEQISPSQHPVTCMYWSGFWVLTPWERERDSSFFQKMSPANKYMVSHPQRMYYL